MAQLSQNQPIRAIQALADMVSGHQIEKARILSYLTDNPGGTVEKLAESLFMPLSTCYKHVDELRKSEIILTIPIKQKKQQELFCQDFVVTFTLELGRKDLESMNRKLTGQAIKQYQFELTSQHAKEFARYLVTITPRNIIAYAAYNKLPSVLSFVRRHGFEKYVTFGKLYEQYRSGRTPVFLIAKELGATRFEIDAMISDLEDFVVRGK